MVIDNHFWECVKYLIYFVLLGEERTRASGGNGVSAGARLPPSILSAILKSGVPRPQKWSIFLDSGTDPYDGPWSKR